MRLLRSATLVVCLVTLVALIAIVAPAHSAPVEQGNVLQNPDFEQGFYQWNNDDHWSVPKKWKPWWESPESDCYNYAPNYNPSTAPQRIHSGLYAASYWLQPGGYGLSYNAGLLQTVDAAPGTVYRFTIWGHSWSTNDPKSTHSDSNTDMQIGIHPKGNENPFSSGVVWSPVMTAMDDYKLFTVEATAESNTITVFVRARPQFCVAKNDTYWDDASLVAIGQASAPTAAPGTAAATTKAPSAPGSDLIPIVTATPRADGSIVHVVQAGDRLIDIAVAYSVPLPTIFELNNLSMGSIIVPGQEIIIQPAQVTQPPAATTEAPPDATGDATDVPPDAATEPTQVADTGGGEPQGKGSVCVMAYQDNNANGVREPAEILLGGITFAVSNSAGTVGTYTTDGVTEPYCFTDLEPGGYTVTWASDMYAPTTDQTWVASLDPGATVNREFGAQPLGETGDKDGEGGWPTWLTALVGALGAILLLGGLGAAGYVLLVRRMQI